MRLSSVYSRSSSPAPSTHTTTTPVFADLTGIVALFHSVPRSNTIADEYCGRSVVSAINVTPRHEWLPILPNYYIKISCGSSHRQTKVIDHNLSPEWNESLRIPLGGEHPKLKIQLYDRSAFPFIHHKMSKIEIKWAELVSRQQESPGKAFQLDMSGHHGHASLLLKVTVPDAIIASKSAVEDARDAVKAAKLRRDRDIPSDDAMDMLKSVAEKLNNFVGILDDASQVQWGTSKSKLFTDIYGQIHPIASVAWKVVSSVIHALNEQLLRDGKVVELISVMDDANSFLGDLKSVEDFTSRMTEFVDATLKQTVECSSFIREYCGIGFMSRAAKQTFDMSADEKIAQFKESFINLQKLRLEGAVVQTAVVSYHVLATVTEINRKLILERLHAVNMDASKRHMCQPNTRIGLLQDLCDWVLSPPTGSKTIYWLHGMTGCGKSTVATTIANFFRELHRLGGFLFFDRKRPQESDPAHVVRTLAAKLATFDHRIAEVISAAVDQNPGLTEGSLRSQFTELLVRPLSSLGAKALSAEGPILVILDALDECGTPSSRAELLDILAAESNNLPNWLRIVITSRTEKDILDKLGLAKHVHDRQLDLADESNKRDIIAFLKTEMRAIPAKFPRTTFPENWANDEVIHKLSDRAAGLFMWAATACKFISGWDPINRLTALLNRDPTQNPESALFELYETALKSVGDWTATDFTRDTVAILGVIVAAEEPLSLEAIDELQIMEGDRRTEQAEEVIVSLGCVLAWKKQRPIRIVHPSFHDYLSSAELTKNAPWTVNLPQYRHKLAFKCLLCVVQHLKREHNAFGTLTSRGKAKEHFSWGTQHAYRYWIEYLQSASGGRIKDFAPSIAFILDPTIYKDFCLVIDMLWTRFVALELTYKMLAWVRVCEYFTNFFYTLLTRSSQNHQLQLSLIDPRITTTAMIKTVDVMTNYLDQPDPGTPHIPDALRTTGTTAVSSAPPKMGFVSIDAVVDPLVHKPNIASSLPMPSAVIPWYLTKPYKQLVELKGKLEADQKAAPVGRKQPAEAPPFVRFPLLPPVGRLSGIRSHTCGPLGFSGAGKKEETLDEALDEGGEGNVALAYGARCSPGALGTALVALVSGWSGIARMAIPYVLVPHETERRLDQTDNVHRWTGGRME
ncbi:hypothetical protein BXZ70DRAFT_908514 [Cristinia sonorae]|uniref:C2 domain-containing protein n=1 Tax=Cristinia sonorae TaxID=1940300 RepID=A0A8K0UKA1_9AGAR|nr:hypothetical protein BXZ70DRAFT_908514 [Cristinia sonorae]